MSNMINKSKLLSDSEVVSRLEKQLDKVLLSPQFKSASKMKLFLKYIVTQTLQGNEERIKQYSIAVDGLGYAEDFDADSNPTVRIMAGRLRERLENYYEKEGDSDPLIIKLEKGKYIPEFEERIPGTKQGKVSNNPTAQTNNKWLYTALTVLVLIVVGFFVKQFILKDTELNSVTSIDFPLVDVMPFDNLTGIDRGRMLTEGIRYQFINELSQFRLIRVRDVPEQKDQQKPSQLKKANYRIKGALLPSEDQIEMTIFLQNTASNEVLWTKKVKVPATDIGFNKLIFEGVKGVMSKISSPSGIMNLDAMTRLKKRLNKDKKGTTSSYECVLLFYDYDNTKDPKTEQLARECLTKHTSNNESNSTLWATHGLMLLLDWTKRKDLSDDSLHEQALKSFKKAILLDPNNAQAYEYLGNFYMVKEQNDKAMEAYEKALKLNPSKPDIHVSIGWMKVNKGNWKEGIEGIRQGIAMSYRPPAWFHIPLAVDAFRREDYKTSLDEAEIIFNSGDKRGIALALAAAIKLEQTDLVSLYSSAYMEYRKEDLKNPLREVSSVLKTPEVLKQYTDTLQPIIKKLESEP